MTRKIMLLTACIISFIALGMEINQVYPPKRLINQSNACFINAPLQLLHAAVDMTSMALELGHYGNENGTIELFRKVSAKMRSDEQTSLHTHSLHNMMWKLLRLAPGQDGDANECLVTLLDQLSGSDIHPTYRCLLPEYTGTKDKRTPLSQLFFAHIIHIQSSPEHLYIGTKAPEQLVGLTIPVTKESLSLTGCLNEYFSGESEHMRVDKDTLVEGTTFHFLHDTQNYVFIMLDRNKAHETEDGLRYERNDNPLSFPLTQLDLTPYFLHKNQAKGPYELIGIIMHSGSAEGGHYTTYSKLGNQWYYCNDDTIDLISLEQIHEIAQRGYGTDKNTIPTTFIYELSSARPTY